MSGDKLSYSTVMLRAMEVIDELRAENADLRSRLEDSGEPVPPPLGRDGGEPL